MTKRTKRHRCLCMECNVLQDELYHPFWTTPNDRNLHVMDNDSQGICLPCMDTLIHSTNTEHATNKIIGYLTTQQKTEYLENVAAHEYNTLLDMGAVVLPYKNHSKFTDPLTLMFYSMIKENRIQTLKDNMHQVEQSASVEHRLWSNLYSESDGRAKGSKLGTSDLNQHCLPFLATYISRKLFPHRSFALQAHHNMTRSNEHILQGSQKSIRQNSITNQNDTEAVLHTEKINVLIRGPNLDTDQTPHIDGFSMKLILLIIDKTGNHGYKFNYVPKSHNLTSAHKDMVTEPLPKDLIETIHAERGSIIVFFENLIHSGGPASTPTMTSTPTPKPDNVNYIPFGRMLHEIHINRINWFHKQNKEHSHPTVSPTDISFQLSLRYGTITNEDNTPNRTNTWYVNQTNDSAIEAPIRTVLQQHSNSGREYLRNNDAAYIKRICQGLRSSRRVKS